MTNSQCPNHPGRAFFETRELLENRLGKRRVRYRAFGGRKLLLQAPLGHWDFIGHWPLVIQCGSFPPRLALCWLYPRKWAHLLACYRMDDLLDFRRIRSARKSPVSLMKMHE